MDKPLLIITLLLVATWVAFFMGLLPYPIGWIVLCFLFIARVMHLKNRDWQNKR
jgi:hypothetical protein